MSSSSSLSGFVVVLPYESSLVLLLCRTCTYLALGCRVLVLFSLVFILSSVKNT